MCRICVEYNLGKLTFDEAWANMRELADSDSHKRDAADSILETLIRKDQNDKQITN